MARHLKKSIGPVFTSKACRKDLGIKGLKLTDTYLVFVKILTNSDLKVLFLTQMERSHMMEGLLYQTGDIAITIANSYIKDENR